MGKHWPKNRKWPSARNGEKLAKKWRKNRRMTPIPIFSPFLAIFCPFWAEGHFLFFGQCFPIFGFQPVFHSIPGGLTRNFWLGVHHIKTPVFFSLYNMLPSIATEGPRMGVAGHALASHLARMSTMTIRRSSETMKQGIREGRRRASITCTTEMQ